MTDYTTARELADEYRASMDDDVIRDWAADALDVLRGIKRPGKTDHDNLVDALRPRLGEIADIAHDLDQASYAHQATFRATLHDQLMRQLAGLYKDLLDLPEWSRLFTDEPVRGTSNTFQDLALELAER